MKDEFECRWDVDRVYDMIRQIAEDIPDRLPGTEPAARMASFSKQRLEEVGVTATVHPVHALVSEPQPATLKILSPNECQVTALTMAHSPNTDAPVVARLVDVGLGGWDDYDGLDAAGQVTLSELSYAPPRQEKQRIAGIKGSAAQIMMNWGYEDSDEVPMGSVKSGWGNPTTRELDLSEASIPCLGVSRRDGNMLRELYRQGPVTVSVETYADTGWRDIHVTTGEIGTSRDKDFALVGGHQDGWFGAAATDNASGSAILVELARVFKAHAAALRRGIVFGFWAGHETGTMAGSSWWADRNWDRLRDHAVGYLQIDQPACAGTFGWAVTSNHELKDMAMRVGRETATNDEIAWGPQVKNGDSSFFGVGVPMMVAHSRFPEEELVRTSNAAYGWWHHTRRNDLDKIDKGLIEKHLDIYAAYLKKLTLSPVLPMRFSGLGQVLEVRLQELRSEDSTDAIGLQDLCVLTARLRPALDRLDLRADELSAADAPNNGAESDINRRLKLLSRTLVPVMSTVVGKYGHDPYGLTEQGTVLPGLFHVGRHAELPRGAEREMVWVELIRARNRISDALVDALSICEA